MPTTSFSRLESYQKCRQFYNLKYNQQEPVDETLKEALVQGSLTHSILEEFLSPDTDTKSIETAFAIVFPRFLKEYDFNVFTTKPSEISLEDEHELQKFGDLGSKSDLLDFVELCRSLAYLLYRASDRCKEPEIAIRNKDGSLLKDPIEYPSMSFKSELVPYLDGKFFWDNEAGRVNDLFIKVSFTWMISKIIFWTHYMRVPSWIVKTKTVEESLIDILPDETEVGIDFGAGFLLNGYIDWVVLAKNDHVCILDHKTSKKCPSKQDVLHHPQLNLYAWAYEQKYGYLPTAIGIHHVPSDSYIIAKVDRSIVQATINYLRDIHLDAVHHKLYTKRHPNEYNSPCISYDWKTGDVKETCPFLHKCWPHYTATLGVI